jgi:hypothetical protein
VLGGSHDLTAAVRATNADLVVLGTRTSRAEVLSQMLELDTLDVRLLDVHHFSEHAFGRVAVDQLSCEWFMECSTCTSGRTRSSSSGCSTWPSPASPS